MKIVVLERKRFTVAAYVRAGDTGEESLVALNELKALGKNYAGSAEGITNLFTTYAEHGRLRPNGVTNEQMHHANYDPDILEFIKGDVRVFCFLDGGMAILTNAGLKTKGKANQKDVNKAIKVMRKYFAAKKGGGLQIKDRSNEH